MRLLDLIIGSVLLLLMFIKAVKGSRYNDYVKDLDSSEYPLPEIYCVGFAWNDGKLLKLRGKLKRMLMKQAKLLYEEKYAEYYATVVWAQTISFVHLCLCAGFIFGGAFDLSLFTFAGIVFAGVSAYYFITRMKEKLETRKTECVVELPEIVSTMALLINSGMILKETWQTIAYNKEGTIYTLMKQASVDMQNGVPEVDAIQKFGVKSDSPEVKKFTGALIQGIEKGSQELSIFLASQSSEMWNLKKQVMLQKGEAAASKLLMPIALIFVGILITIISATVGMML